MLTPAMDKGPLLALKRVSRAFAVRRGWLGEPQRLIAVDQASLDLYGGESLGLVGESGCGKSTLGRLACGLLTPSSGEVLLEGRPLPLAGARSWAAGRIQMVFQDPFSSLNPRMSVRAAVAEPLAAQGMPAPSGAGWRKKCSPPWVSTAWEVAIRMNFPAGSASASLWRAL